MIGTQQLAAALYGVWLLLKLDPRAFEYFEKTPGGFARSFLPALLLVPLNLVHEVLAYDPAKASLAFAPFLVVQLLASIVGWTLYPLVMIYIARWFAREERYLTYIVPYNWFQLPMGLLMIPIVILTDLKLVPMAAAEFAGLLAIMMFFTFGSFMARIGLQVGIMTSIGFVIIDLLLTIVANQLIDRI